MKIKKKTYYFLISFTVTSCLICGLIGICAAYESITEIANGEQKRAVDFGGGKFRFLDFEFDI